jgi:hypothetical protein
MASSQTRRKKSKQSSMISNKKLKDTKIKSDRLQALPLNPAEKRPPLTIDHLSLKKIKDYVIETFSYNKRKETYNQEHSSSYVSFRARCSF